jgi:hypothetical protein
MGGAPARAGRDRRGLRARSRLGAVDADLALVVGDGRARSDTVRVRADERPFVGDVAVRAEYPAYLGRAAEVLPAGDVLRVPRGTALEVRARASAALARAALVGPGGRTALAASGGTLGARLSRGVRPVGVGARPTRAARRPTCPPPLDVVVVPDSAPVVVIAAPAADTAIDGLGAVPVRVRPPTTTASPACRCA